MNCYYFNLIEGNDTHPVEIERALNNDYSQDASRRDLQLEAKAHIAVHKWIERGGLRGGRAIKAKGIQEIHRRFCEWLPEDLFWVEDPVTWTKLQVAPGEWRHIDIQAGTHVAISPGAARRFLERFARVST